MWNTVFLLCCLSFSMTLSAQTQIKVLAFAGSSRADSANKKLVIEAAQIARGMGADVTYIDLKDYPVPLYDGDLEAKEGMPEYAKHVRRLMIHSQVILIASPEYNHSVSALLKNTIDWASRNEQGGSSREAFKGKKFVLMSASPGKSGGARGLTHLKDIIQDVGGIIMPQQISVSNSYQAFDEKGNLKDDALRTQLTNLVKQSLLH